MVEMTDAEREAVWEKRRQEAIREHNEYVRKLEETGKKLARALARVTGADARAGLDMEKLAASKCINGFNVTRAPGDFGASLHDTYGRTHDMELVLMKPDEFLRSQFEANLAGFSRDHPYRKEFAELGYERAFERWKDTHDYEYLQTMATSLKEGRCALEVPVIELVKGHLYDWQEGRHRGVAAEMAGMDLMPVFLAHRLKEVTRRYDPKPFKRPHISIKLVPPKGTESGRPDYELPPLK